MPWQAVTKPHIIQHTAMPSCAPEARTSWSVMKGRKKQNYNCPS